MKSKKTTVITYTTREILIVRKTGSNNLQRWCSICKAIVETFAPVEAAMILGVSLSYIHQNIANGSLHSLEEKSTPLMVCSNSLLKDPDNLDPDSRTDPTLKLEE